MPVALRVPSRPTRRRFLKTSAASLALAGIGGLAAPSLSRTADRPRIDGGLQSGDVTQDSAVVWARADRPARMQVEFSTVESFANISRVLSADALPERDFTAKLLVEGLPPDQEIFYRVRFHEIQEPLIFGEVQTGRFRTAPGGLRSVSFLWSGHVAGQGWGIDLSRGGMRSFKAMRDNAPDFFIHSGDSIYADCAGDAEGCRQYPHLKAMHFSILPCDAVYSDNSDSDWGFKWRGRRHWRRGAS